jgi:ABC-type nitrate/sulfonate/bicarbonate transport system permease component
VQLGDWADGALGAAGMNATKRRVLAIRTLTILAALCLWETLGRSGLFYAGVLPSSLQIAEALWRELIDPGFYNDFGITLLETVVGFLVGAAIGVAVGIALGIGTYARRMIEPMIVAVAGTPKIIFLPILFLIFGLGLESKMAKGALSAFFPVVLSTVAGFLQIPKVLLRVGESFHLSWWQMAWKIHLPAMSVPLLTGLRLGMAMAIIGVLTAEMTYANAGLGFRLLRDADQFRIPSVYAIIILIFALSAAVNSAISRLEDRLNRHERRRGGVIATAATETALIAAPGPTG